MVPNLRLRASLLVTYTITELGVPVVSFVTGFRLALISVELNHIKCLKARIGIFEDARARYPVPISI